MISRPVGAHGADERYLSQATAEGQSLEHS